MRRFRSTHLAAWADRTDRRPLILRGARQVGKSWLARSFGVDHFGSVAEVNFEREPALAAAFDEADPKATLTRLEVLLRRAIPADGSTLLFLDEIQAAPRALARLRYFAEELPRLPVIAAGSLLDFALEDPALSVPVGRVTYLHLEPLGFEEFCSALGEHKLIEWMQRIDARTMTAGRAIPPELHARAMALFRTWLVVGGMPAAVAALAEHGSVLRAVELHRDLLATLRDDFAKYASRVHHQRLAAVLRSVPQQLGAKFVYQAVDPKERTAALRTAVDLLCRARLCHRVMAATARGVPLGAGVDDRGSKLLHLDVGLACTSLGLALNSLEQAQDLILVNQGAVTEQAVGQLLRLACPANEEPTLYHWRRQARGAEAEIDYVFAHDNHVVPIEVKSGTTGSHKSLHAFVAERELEVAVRFNAAPPEVIAVDVKTTTGDAARYTLWSLPCYLTEQLPRLLNEVWDQPVRRRRKK